MGEASSSGAPTGPARRTCVRCGRSAAVDHAWAWSQAVDADGRSTWVCPDCARQHARDIEAKLDDAWW